MNTDVASAERRLLSAVLVDALRVLYFGRRACQRREVWTWMTDPFGFGPFAFGSLCEALELDAGSVRTLVRHNLEQLGRPLPSTVDRAA